LARALITAESLREFRDLLHEGGAI
jgi:hypothetical protein